MKLNNISMKKEIKNFFLTFIKLNKKGLILALLFFLVFGLIFPSQKTWAQIEGFSLNCGWYDLFCHALEAFLSGILKIVILIFFGIPLLLSALFVGIMALILGWIISPDFISLKFTQNPFVNIGLSITKNFANMGFIIFLVAIALATALRIEEYKAKKTLITLILIALLVNFSPVLCGFIIDASNIVMDFFLNHVTGLLGFYNFVMGAAQALWNLIVTSGFNLWANISAAMQILIMIVFNFFAGFIFILFSALFIMRYIMLWILVILSPIAFVSYILPITRRGRSLLSWRTWWEQLIAWSIIGIIAAFFLYLGFTMIAMINANPRQFVCLPGDQNCGPGGLGLMNNILPYLIPLVLLWIAYRETKKTTAMFAREIVEMPEKVAKGAVMAAAIAATAGTAAAAGGALKALPATVGKLGKAAESWSKKHPVASKALIAPAVTGWASRKYGEKIKPAIAKVRPAIRTARDRAKEWAWRHPKILKVARGAKTAGGVLKEILWAKKKEPTEEEIRKRAYEIYQKRLAGKEPGYTHAEIDAMLIKTGMTPRTPEADEFMRKWDWEQARKQLRPKIPEKYRPLLHVPPAKEITKTVKEGFRTAWKEWQKRAGLIIPREEEKLEDLIRKREAGETLTMDDVRGFRQLERLIETGRQPSVRLLRTMYERRRKKRLGG
jgi:hypothetical protein